MPQKLRIQKILAIVLFIFALFETIIAVISLVVSPSCSFAWACLQNSTTFFATFVRYSIPASIASWSAFGVVAAALWRTSIAKYRWNESGFSKDAYNLMIKMRGASSRLALLRNLSTPRHRAELSKV
ncbi:MAG: hypothetical protein M1368_07160 [Thaumarchaeota archaeon]|nr:hypothetical protein [Nitrososphaerota archaeon]